MTMTPRSLGQIAHSANAMARCLLDERENPGRRTPRPTGAVLLNTSLGSRNAGDDIIMHFSRAQLATAAGFSDLQEYPVHCRWVDMDAGKRAAIKLVCGTNAISTRMGVDCPLGLPREVDLYRGTLLLMGVGRRVVWGREEFSRGSAAMLRYLLSPDLLHSVRDERTRRCLAQVGIHNVVNTSCVTMWGLSPDVCERIPRTRSDEALATLTDYSRNPKIDGIMLETLLRKYRRVHLWLQGTGDFEYASRLVDVSRLNLIDGSFASLRSFVETRPGPVDYVGTRLHCGIFCLNVGIRSLIVSVDNRARDIHEDTGLPIIRRREVPERLEELIDSAFRTEINLPVREIERWKSQLGDLLGA